MTEPTITCPNCHTEIKLTESLAAPLIAATRKQFEQQLAQKDSDIAQREQAMREKEIQLLDAKAELDEQVADKVAEQLKQDRARIAAEESKKAKLAAATDLEQKAQELADLKEVRRSAAISPTLEEKLSWQKKQRELEGKRSRLRRELFARQDEVEAQRNELISQLEVQLQQQVEKRTLFTVKWEMK